MAAEGRSSVGPTDMVDDATLSLQRGTYRIDVKRIGDRETHKIFEVYYQSS
jgi:hypothetical protein